MYFVKYGSSYLHDPRIDGYVLLDLSFDTEENSCGYCDFTIYPDHPLYDKLKERDADNPIEVYDGIPSDETRIFSGFIYELGKEFYLDGHVKCKGELDYLNDSIVRPYATYQRGYGDLAPYTLNGYFEWLIKQHNNRVDPNKRFVVGVNQAANLVEENLITIENSTYPSTMDEISNNLLSVYGGYLRVRKVNGTRYIDYLSEWTDTNSQILDFGVNLTDYTQTDDSNDIATFVVPLGAKMSDTEYEYDDGYFVTQDTSVDHDKIYYTERYEYVYQEGITEFNSTNASNNDNSSTTSTSNTTSTSSGSTISELKTIEIEKYVSGGLDFTIELTVKDDYDSSTGYSDLTITKARLKSSWDGFQASIDGSVYINGNEAADFIESANWYATWSYYSFEHTPQTANTIRVPHNSDGSLSVVLNLKARPGSSYTYGFTFIEFNTYTAEYSVYPFDETDNTLVLTTQTPITPTPTPTPTPTTHTYYEYNEETHEYVQTSDTSPVAGKKYYLYECTGYSECNDLTEFATGTSYYEYDPNEDESQLPLTISDLQDGEYETSGYKKLEDKVYYETAVNKYGWIGTVYENSEITDRDILRRIGTIVLQNMVSPKRTIEIKAVDMHLVNPSIKPIKVGEYVRVRSEPHNLDGYFLCSSVSLDLDNPDNSIYTLGTTFDTLTGQQNKKINELNATINKQYEATAAISEEAKSKAISAKEAADSANEKSTTVLEAYESGELDGDPSYVHIKYSNDAGSTFTGNSGNDPGDWMGTYTDHTESASSSTSEYTWSKIKGETGPQGKSIGTVTNYYLATNLGSGVNKSTPGWTTTVQSVSPYAKYLWNYEIILYSDGTTASDTAPCIIGSYGDTGASGSAGKGISSIAEYYAVSTSKTTEPTVWVNDPSDAVLTSTNKYLWNYEVLTYTDSTSHTTSKRVIGVYGDTGADGTDGEDGVDGVGITSIDTWYAKSSSSTTAPTTGWTTTAPTWEDGKYIWSKTITTLTSGYPNESTPVCLTGQKGSTGNTGASGTGVSSITEQYYLSTSKETQTGGSWSTAAPTWSSGKYIWTRSKIVYNNPASTVYTSPICDSSWEAVNEIEIGGRNLLALTKSVRYNNPITANGITISGPDAYGWFTVSGTTTEAGLARSLTLWGNATNAPNEYLPQEGGTYDLSVEYTDGTFISGSAYTNSTHVVLYYNSSNRRVAGFNPDEITFEVGSYIYRVAYYIGTDIPNGTTINGRFRLKLEKGNKATDWSPSPEDVDNDIYNASKVATNYMDWQTGTGLVIGDMTSSSLGKNTLIDSTGMAVRDGSTELARFGSNRIVLGQNSSSSVIAMRNDTLKIESSSGGTHEYTRFTCDDNLEVSSSFSSTGRVKRGGVAITEGIRNATTWGDFNTIKWSELTSSTWADMAGDGWSRIRGTAFETKLYATESYNAASNQLVSAGVSLSTDFSENMLTSSIKLDAGEIVLKADKVRVKSDGSYIMETPVLLSGNCNNLIESGRYYLGNNSTNRPINENGWLETMNYTSSYCYQKYVTYTGKVYERNMINGSWGAWGRQMREYLLFNNDSSSMVANVNLSEAAQNFEKFTIMYRTNDNHFSSIDVYNPNGKMVVLSAGEFTGSGNVIVKTKTMLISGTSMTVVVSSDKYLTGEAICNGSQSSTNANVVAVTQVIGWK